MAEQDNSDAVESKAFLVGKIKKSYILAGCALLFAYIQFVTMPGTHRINVGSLTEYTLGGIALGAVMELLRNKIRVPAWMKKEPSMLVGAILIALFFLGVILLGQDNHRSPQPTDWNLMRVLGNLACFIGGSALHEIGQSYLKLLRLRCAGNRPASI